jgi:hypothetical protein
VIPGRTLRENEPGDGRLSPWTGRAADAPGWQITTRSRRLAGAVATVMSGGTVHSHTTDEWHARIPQAVLMVVVIGAGTDALRCHLSTRPQYGVFVLAFCRSLARRNRAEMPPGRVAGVGTVSFAVRDVRVITRMGRTVRYLVPVFAWD